MYHLLQALRLACVHIWHVSPTVSLAFLVLMTLQGIGPLATVWAGKLLLDAILAALSTQGSPAALRGVMVALVIQLGILVANTVVAHLSQFLSSLMGKRLTLRMEHAVLKKTSELDMSYFDNAAFYNMITRAQREAKAKPLTLLVSMTSIGRNAITFVSMAVVVSLIGAPYLVAMIVLSIPILFIEIRYGEKYYWLQLYQTHEARMANYLSGVMTKREYVSEILS